MVFLLYQEQRTTKVCWTKKYTVSLGRLVFGKWPCCLFAWLFVCVIFFRRGFRFEFVCTHTHTSWNILCIFRRISSPKCPPFSYSDTVFVLSSSSIAITWFVKWKNIYFRFYYKPFPLRKIICVTAFPKNLERFLLYQHSMVLTFRVCVVQSAYYISSDV